MKRITKILLSLGFSAWGTLSASLSFLISLQAKRPGGYRTSSSNHWRKRHTVHSDRGEGYLTRNRQPHGGADEKSDSTPKEPLGRHPEA